MSVYGFLVASAAAAAPPYLEPRTLLIGGSEKAARAVVARLDASQIGYSVLPRLETLEITPVVIASGAQGAWNDAQILQLAEGLQEIRVAEFSGRYGVGGGQTGSLWVTRVLDESGAPGPVVPAHFEGQYAIAQVRAGEAHERATGRGVVIAVIDTGILRNDFLLPYLAPFGSDFLSADDPPYDTGDGQNDDVLANPGSADTDIDESLGHGTFIGSVLALVAPEARQLHIRAMDADGITTGYLVAQAIEEAIGRGAHVISLSLVVENLQPPAPGQQTLLEAACARAEERGITIVASAGKSDANTAFLPAAYPTVLAVGACGADGVFATPVSNHGAHIDVSAPGASATMVVREQAVPVTAAEPASSLFGLAIDDSRAPWAAGEGTSIAAAWVAGAAALVRSSRPDWPSPSVPLAEVADSVRRSLTLTASPVGTPDPSYGGLVGTGIVDCASAVAPVAIGAVPVFPLDIVPSVDPRTGLPTRRIDAADLGVLLGSWGQVEAGSVSYADLDGSGVVDSVDLALLLGAWTG